MLFAVIDSIRRHTALDVVLALVSAQPCLRGNTRDPILLGLELEQAEQIVEVHDVFILGLLFVRESPQGTLCSQLCNPP
jgi:hypothetical protein